MPLGEAGFQPRNTPAERRAFFDLDRKLRALPTTETVDAAIADGDAATLTAANAYVDALMTPVVGTITNTASWTPTSGFQHSLIKIGKLVILNVSLRNGTGATTAANPQICTIPAGFRPAGLVRVGASIASVTPAAAQVSSAGAVQAVCAGVPINNDVCFTCVYQQVN